jgi:hypothetical protein
VAHDREKLVPRRKRIVGQLAFMRKVFVRFLAFAPQQREMLRAFLAKAFVRVGSLFLRDLILTSSLALENVRNGRAWHGRAIGLCAGCRQHLVRTAPSGADHSIGRFIDCVVLKSLIRSACRLSSVCSRSRRRCWSSGNIDAAKCTSRCDCAHVEVRPERAALLSASRVPRWLGRVPN